MLKSSNTSAPETTVPAARLTTAECHFAVGLASALSGKLQAEPVKLREVVDIFVGLQTSVDSVLVFEDDIRIKSDLAKVWPKELEREVVIERALLKPVIQSGRIGRCWATPSF